MRWTPTGEKICIAYDDGAVIVGRWVWAGWGRERELAAGSWLPSFGAQLTACVRS
jgi:hypothetical protein